MAFRVAILLGLGLAIGGCGDSPSTARDPAAEARSEVPSVVHSATGTFNSADASAGTINISHEAVPSAEWPAMTMDFHLRQGVDTSRLQRGQRIAFKFTTDDQGGGTVTEVEAAQ